MHRRWLTVFYSLQGASVLGWWLLLGLWPAALDLFVSPAARVGFLYFILPDLLLLVGGSAMTASLLARGWRPVGLAWLLTGASGFAALWCLAQSLHTGAGWLGTLLMLAMAGVNATLARRLGRAH